MRAESGEALDELGWLPVDRYRFIPVEIQGKKIYIARYPVTNAQYERFLKSENFTEAARDLWTGFPQFDEHNRPMDTIGDKGWTWLQGAKTGPDYDPIGDILLPRYWRDPRFGINHRSYPVVGVTWWEANAYCRWLQRTWQDREESHENPDLTLGVIRLPLEFEWEFSAGGLEPKGRYPWDKGRGITENRDDILQRANTGESGIRHTTPVAMYPLGASEPWQVMDLAGNVWEWQANYYDKDHDLPALRGGSWYYLQDSARVAVHYWDPPGSGTSTLVFGWRRCPELLFSVFWLLRSVGIGSGEGAAPLPQACIFYKEALENLPEFISASLCF